MVETFVVTGASSGVGAAAARRLAEPGRRLVLIARRRDALASVAEDVRRAGAEAEVAPCDVSDAAAVEDAFALAGPRLQALVNAAALPANAVGDTPPAEIARVVAVNLVGAMLCARAAAARMGPDGVILNVGSLCVRVRDGGASLYVATKTGLDGFTDAFRKELAPRGVRVVLVNPGQIASGMVTESEGEKAAAVAREAMLTPDEVAEAIAFCLRQPGRVAITEMELRPRAQSSL